MAIQLSGDPLGCHPSGPAQLPSGAPYHESLEVLRHWKSATNCIWMVVGIPTPLKNDGLRQLGSLFHSQYDGKNEKCSKPPTRYRTGVRNCAQFHCNQHVMSMVHHHKKNNSNFLKPSYSKNNLYHVFFLLALTGTLFCGISHKVFSHSILPIGNFYPSTWPILAACMFLHL